MYFKIRISPTLLDPIYTNISTYIHKSPWLSCRLIVDTTILLPIKALAIISAQNLNDVIINLSKA